MVKDIIEKNENIDLNKDKIEKLKQVIQKLQETALLQVHKKTESNILLLF